MVTDLKKDKLSNKSRIDSEIMVTWQHTQELSPAFRKLMALLLRPREANTSKEEKEVENER